MLGVALAAVSASVGASGCNAGEGGIVELSVRDEAPVSADGRTHVALIFSGGVAGEARGGSLFIRGAEGASLTSLTIVPRDEALEGLSLSGSSESAELSYPLGPALDRCGDREECVVHFDVEASAAGDAPVELLLYGMIFFARDTDVRDDWTLAMQIDEGEIIPMETW